MNGRRINVNRNALSENMLKTCKPLVILAIIGFIALPSGKALKCYQCTPTESNDCEQVNENMSAKCPADTTQPPTSTEASSPTDSTEASSSTGSTEETTITDTTEGSTITEPVETTTESTSAPGSSSDASSTTVTPGSSSGASSTTAAAGGSSSASTTPAAPGSSPGASTTPAAPGSSSGASTTPAAPGSSSGASSTTAAAGSSSGASTTPAAPGSSSGASTTPAAPGSSSGAASTTAAAGSSSGASSTHAAAGSSSGASSTPAAPGSSSGASSTPAAAGSSSGASSTTAAAGSSSGASSTHAAAGSSSGASSTPAAPGSSSGASSTPAAPGSSSGASSTPAAAGSSSDSSSAAAASDPPDTPGDDDIPRKRRSLISRLSRVQPFADEQHPFCFTQNMIVDNKTKTQRGCSVGNMDTYCSGKTGCGRCAVRNCPRIRACSRLGGSRAPGSSVSSPPGLLPPGQLAWSFGSLALLGRGREQLHSLELRRASPRHGRRGSEEPHSSVYRLPPCAPRRVSSTRLSVSFAPKTPATLLLLLSSCPPTTPDFPESLRSVSSRRRSVIREETAKRRHLRGSRGGRVDRYRATELTAARHARSPCLNPPHSSPNREIGSRDSALSCASGTNGKMNAPVYASSCPALQSNLSLHSSSYYSEYSGAARRRLSSTGEADTSATSSYEGSDSSENSDESRLEPVSQMEREQLETFFRGLKSQVFVCESLANLYLGNASQTESWDLRFTGIPVVVLDLGETRSRSKRRIQILLAERGTCFTLWRETIDNLSSYKVSGPAFHTMCLSSDHTRLAGLSFDNPKAANDLWQHIERLVSCPENISLSVPGKKKKKPVQKKIVLPAKSNISQPCQFQHVTSVDAADRSRYFSLQTLVPALNELANSLEANF